VVGCLVGCELYRFKN
jgi:uncharacterized membrane protein YgcG